MSVYWFRQASQDPCTTGLFCSMLICPNLSIIHLLSESNINLAFWAKRNGSFCSLKIRWQQKSWRLRQPNWFSGKQRLWVLLCFPLFRRRCKRGRTKLANTPPPTPGTSFSRYTLSRKRKEQEKKIRIRDFTKGKIGGTHPKMEVSLLYL